jgi:hypothetical protein
LLWAFRQTVRQMATLKPTTVFGSPAQLTKIPQKFINAIEKGGEKV